MFVTLIIFTLLSCVCLPTYAQNATEISVNRTTLIGIQQVAEGGNIELEKSSSSTTETTRPYGREHVTNKSSISSTSTTEKVIPISEKSPPEVIAEKNDNKKTVPRKGVDYNESSKNITLSNTTIALNISSTTTALKVNSSAIIETSSTMAPNDSVLATTSKPTSKALPKKPLLTIGNDEEPYAPSHFVSSKGKNVSATIPKVPSIESYSSKGGSDYTIAIVGVILSVPLVAIIMNMVYKRTKEWWHHRHYSRMDFLIDGIYNN